MQSRLFDNTASTSIRALSTVYRRHLQRRFCAASSGQTAEPAVHSGEREASPAVHKGEPQGIKSTTSTKFAETEHAPREDEFLETPKSPYESSAKLKSNGVNQRLDPSFQQKRKQGTKVSEEVSCAGLDGSPWPKDDADDQRNRAEKLEDEREYYKHHKASPLSELEFADSRKPIARATDGTADLEQVGRGLVGCRSSWTRRRIRSGGLQRYGGRMLCVVTLMRHSQGFLGLFVAKIFENNVVL